MEQPPSISPNLEDQQQRQVRDRRGEGEPVQQATQAVATAVLPGKEAESPRSSFEKAQERTEEQSESLQQQQQQEQQAKPQDISPTAEGPRPTESTGSVIQPQPADQGMSGIPNPQPQAQQTPPPYLFPPGDSKPVYPTGVPVHPQMGVPGMQMGGMMQPSYQSPQQQQQPTGQPGAFKPQMGPVGMYAPSPTQPLQQQQQSPLDLFTIYAHPRDFPDHFVVRRWRVDQSGAQNAGLVGKALSLEEARRLVPPGTRRNLRDPNDDPVIVESWL